MPSIIYDFKPVCTAPLVGHVSVVEDILCQQQDAVLLARLQITGSSHPGDFVDFAVACARSVHKMKGKCL